MTSTATTEARHGLLRRSLQGALLRWRDYTIAASFVALFVYLSFASSAFLTSQNLLNILDQNADVGIIACAGTLVVICGGFDLSTAATYALGGVVAAKLAQSIDPTAAMAFGVLCGLVAGIANGLVVTVGKVNAFIATLATGLVIRGIALLVTDGNIISVPDPSFSTLGRNELLGAKLSVWVFVGFAVITGLLLARTTIGRYWYAVGGNAEAARLSGLRVNGLRVATFAISGSAAALAGVIVASRVASAQADAGTGIELTAIAAIVLGGTSILGGQGAVWRTVIGVLILALIANGFDLLSLNPLYQEIVQGSLILLAVALDARTRGARQANVHITEEP
jgi:ribose transport system permease protein